MKKIGKYKGLLNFIKEDKWRIVFASIIIFINGLVGILTGYLNGRAVEAITKNMLKESVVFLIIYLFLELFFYGLLNIIANSILSKTEKKLTSILSYETYRKALNLPAVAYEELSSGEITNRILDDSDVLSSTFRSILDLFTDIIGTIIILVYIIFNSVIVAIFIIVFMVILIFILKKYTPKMKELHKETKKESDKFTTLTTESIRGIREIKTLGIKNNLLKDMKEIINLILKRSNNEIDNNTKFKIVTRFLRGVLEVGTFIICIFLIYYGKASITFFIAMTYYVYRFMYLFDDIESLTESYQKVTVSLGRINDILENRLYQDVKFGSKELINSIGKIEFEHVSFSYPNEEDTLNDFNVVIEPNKKIAIVGKSGQGKSTLFNLITRIFDVKSGVIKIDDIDIKELTEETLRREVSIIRQDPFIFNRTIKENFELIDKNITLDEIRIYTKMAYLDDYIENLPKQYDTMLGEGGINLSGGQKQRLAIARTLAKKSKIILFDEATSALDNESQNYIKKSIDNLIKNHTVVIIAHRLSTIIDADTIYVVDDGKIIASGEHQELLKNCKLYQKLYKEEIKNN